MEVAVDGYSLQVPIPTGAIPTSAIPTSAIPTRGIFRQTLRYSPQHQAYCYCSVMTVCHYMQRIVRYIMGVNF